MPFKEPVSSFRDILNAIDSIEAFVAGTDYDSFQSDSKTIAAVERKLQVISEAAIRLGSEAEERCPGLPWRDIRGIGNQLRHAYDRIDLEQIWITVSEDLPRLKAPVVRVVKELS